MTTPRFDACAVCLSVAIWLTGCGGSAKTAPQADAGRTTRPADAAVADAGPRDAGADAPDAGGSAHETCTTEPMPRWPGFDPGTVMSATRIPLAVLCPAGACPATLQAFASSLRCSAPASVAGDAEDAGWSCPLNDWLRREGCGQVQFDTIPCRWPRHFNFDASTGALVGAARLDDIGEPLAGTRCLDAGYVAGRLLRDCASVTVSECTAVSR